MALKVEGVVDGSVHAEKTLGGSSRFEPLHFVLSSSHHLMRVFGSAFVNLATRGMLIASVAQRLESEGLLLAYCAAPL